MKPLHRRGFASGVAVVASMVMGAACSSGSIGDSATGVASADEFATDAPTATTDAPAAAPATLPAVATSLPLTIPPAPSTATEPVASATAATSPATTPAPPGTEAPVVADDGRPRTLDQAFALVRPLVIAHAGGDLEAPHSTMFAFARAAALGADVLEMDVRLSKDGVLIVQHDDTVDRTANATGPVAALTVAELKRLDNAYWFVPGCWSCHERSADEAPYRGIRTGDRPPPPGFTADDFTVATLDEVMTRFPDMILDIEIKGEGLAQRATAETLAERLDGTPDEKRVVVASFSDELLDVFRAAAPNVVTSPGLTAATAFVLDDTPTTARVLQVPPTFNGLIVVNDALMAKLKKAGMELWVWPESSETDDAPAYQAMIDIGADGVIAGRPSVLHDLVYSES